MITAKEIMRTDTPMLSFDETVSRSIEYLSESQSGFAVVSASRERLQGVLHEGNLLKIFLRYKQNPAKDSLILYREFFEPIQLIHENEIFPEIVKKLLIAVGNRVFVINNGGELVGHITAKDILPFLEEKTAEKMDQFALMKHRHGELETVKSEMYLFESFFLKSPFMMHSANENGVIQMANEMLHSVLGYEYGALIGKTIFDIYPPESHAAATEGLKSILNKGYHNIVLAKMVTADKKLIEIEMVSRCLENQHKKIIGTMTISRPLDMNVLLSSLPHL